MLEEIGTEEPIRFGKEPMRFKKRESWVYNHMGLLLIQILKIGKMGGTYEVRKGEVRRGNLIGSHHQGLTGQSQPFFLPKEYTTPNE